MASKNYHWYKVAESIEEIDFSVNGIAEILVANKKLCLILFKDDLTACAQKCPHAGGNMSDGYVDALGNVVCPLHRYKFSLQNGRNVTGEGFFLKIFPVEIRHSAVFVGIEENNFWNLLK